VHGHHHDQRWHRNLLQHWGTGQSVALSHGWPLSTDDWDTQMLVQNGTLKIYPGFPHGMPTTEASTINADLLALIQS
jgi:non-heme chloroperoxidase